MGNICTHCLWELKAPIQQKAQQPLQLVAVGPQKLNRPAGLCSCSRCLWFGGEREAVRRSLIWGIRWKEWSSSGIRALRAGRGAAHFSPEVFMCHQCQPMSYQVKVWKGLLCFSQGLTKPSLKSVGAFPLTSVGFGWALWGVVALQPQCCGEPDARRGASGCPGVNHGLPAAEGKGSAREGRGCWKAAGFVCCSFLVLMLAEWSGVWFRWSLWLERSSLNCYVKKVALSLLLANTHTKRKKKKSLIPREDCYSDRIVLFRSMQNQSHSQMVFRLVPAGWGIHTCVCQHSHVHTQGTPPGRGERLCHLCHPLGSEADTANPLHVFNVAHARLWSRASIPQVSLSDVPTAVAESVLTPGWTSPQQQPELLQCLQVLLRDISLPLPAKTGLPALCSTLPSPQSRSPPARSTAAGC